MRVQQQGYGNPMILVVIAAALLLLPCYAFSPIFNARKQQRLPDIDPQSTSLHHPRIYQHNNNANVVRRYQRLQQILYASAASSDPLSHSPTPATTTTTTTTTKKRKLQSFSRYLEVECWKQQPDVRQLEQVLQSFADACKQINRIVQRAQTDELYGNFGPATNVQGETPQKLDVLCNTVMLQSFCGTGGGRSIHAVASEEEEHPRLCETVMNDVAFRGGDFLAVFDPIDGSKNIDASLPVGTIFGVYRKPHTAAKKKSSSDGVNGDMSQQQQEEETKELEKLFHQDGSALVAAGYCLYSYVPSGLLLLCLPLVFSCFSSAACMHLLRVHSLPPHTHTQRYNRPRHDVGVGRRRFYTGSGYRTVSAYTPGYAHPPVRADL